jgi:hypothetical protein
MYELLEQCVMPTLHAADDALRRPVCRRACFIVYEIEERTELPFCNSSQVHLLGIGDAPSIVRLVAQGIDTFDSAYPSRCGRHGTLLRFDAGGVDALRNRSFDNDFPRRAGDSANDNDNDDYPFDNDDFQLPVISNVKAASAEFGIVAFQRLFAVRRFENNGSVYGIQAPQSIDRSIRAVAASRAATTHSRICIICLKRMNRLPASSARFTTCSISSLYPPPSPHRIRSNLVMS